MNANELADLIECACCAYQKEAATMLRQQQAEIAALRRHRAWIEETAVKELTNEEIAQEWGKFYPDVFHTHLIDFARAILRKASEK